MEQFDIAVVGGGPAGASAGRAAATAGADVVVLEKGVPREDRAGKGPDSTDAAGLLDYWLDIAGFDFDEIPEDVVLRELSGAEFIGPTEAVEIDRTGMEASYDRFGITVNRVKMDDWLRDRAAAAGAAYRVDAGVRDVETDLNPAGVRTQRHEIVLTGGATIEAEYLILADGPQRQVTNRVLDRFLPEESITDYVGTREANHIAYQEHRRFPEELFEPEMLKFWWGAIPGETAYPWVFPNDGTVARVGLTMPIGLTKEAVDDPTSYWLVDPEDDQLPSPSTYLERLLERVYPEYTIDDFPLVEDRGKQGGTETYAISSTQPIDSPTEAGIAVTGGAMGTTSAFHEGGYHVAARTGAIAGRLAATDTLGEYNDAWKDAVGPELLRNVAFADVVEGYEPADWDRAFRTVRKLMSDDNEGRLIRPSIGAGAHGASLYAKYRWAKRKYSDAEYVQLPESAYQYRRSAAPQ